MFLRGGPRPYALICITLNRFFSLSAFFATRVGADSSVENKALSSKNDDTEEIPLLLLAVPPGTFRYAVERVDNAMPCHRKASPVAW